MGDFQHGFLLCLPLLALVCLLPMPEPAGAVEIQNQVREVPREETLRYLRRTLQALGDAMGFFHSKRTQVNLDGVIGTRMVEGTMKVLLAKLRASGQLALLPPDVAVDIRSIYHLSRTVSDETVPHVASKEPRYYGRLWPLIMGGTWELNYPTRNLSASVPTWPVSDSEDMKEEESDNCLTEVFGTSGTTNETCLISDRCWERMTNEGYHRYSLTHQIFYLQLAERTGCSREVEWYLRNHSQPGLRYLQDMFCANILSEAKSLAEGGFPEDKRDLFMEQAGLCGMYGYWEFFRYSWLDKILSWQNKEHGCYQNDDWPWYLQDERSRRRKREEYRVDNGCLSHMTTVAAAAHTLYARYLTEAYLYSLDHLGVQYLYWD
ncbi:hypothetical protein ACOMHN_026836 [Nucella lapillus]